MAFDQRPARTGYRVIPTAEAAALPDAAGEIPALPSTEAATESKGGFGGMMIFAVGFTIGLVLVGSAVAGIVPRIAFVDRTAEAR